MSMKEIVILGGGFAGVAAAKQLLKHNTSHIKITLIDKKNFQLFTPSLYEVATSEEPQQNIALPYSQIFGDKVRIITASVSSLNSVKHVLKLHTGEDLHYDYLLLALGSEPTFYHIPGLKEHALSLKSLEDAVKIKNKISHLCCKEGACNRNVKVIIGGGGFAGTELAAELLTYKDRLAKQHHLDKDCLDISIIQGSDRLLKELDPHVSVIAEKRMKSPQIHFCFGGHIKEVTETQILTDNGKSYPYDIFLWTGGVQANSFLGNTGFSLSKHGQVIVDDHLRVEGKGNIFAAGDVAGFTDKTGKSAPGVAQVAEDEGRVAGENIYRTIMNKELLIYKIQHWGYIVPLRGKFASAELMGHFHFDGFMGWVLQQLVFLRYLLGIFPFWKAFRRWNSFEVNLEQ